MALTESKGQATLKAQYASPKGTNTFVHPLDAPRTSQSAKERSAYFSALRTSVTKLQEEINTFLTQKMEEDKTLLVDRGGKTDDTKDEDNYGEEILDQEEDFTAGLTKGHR
ncbi:MAG: hypothetical protein M1830_002344 [Pleopsidium flavum]|nr:MAG: hypothetical protein M1830_002344 [Pleopsidium flavum]